MPQGIVSPNYICWKGVEMWLRSSPKKIFGSFWRNAWLFCSKNTLCFGLSPIFALVQEKLLTLHWRGAGRGPGLR